jgi:two-component sensor histidine kinase
MSLLDRTTLNGSSLAGVTKKSTIAPLRASHFFYELATNAAKYGALSASTGVIHIDCSSKEDWLVMTWEERGGPLIKGPPNREGFGGTLARKIVASQFRGRLSNEWNSRLNYQD